MIVREIYTKSILTNSRIPGVTYCLNPYVGCAHGCRYCYARFMKKFTGHTEPWGDFVDVKVNAPVVLAGEIKRKKRESVLLSSVTDPYQPLEKRFKITRKCLEILLQYQWPISILTKSNLVLRDIDLLKKFMYCEVGLTITTDSEEIRKIFEPGSSSLGKRLEALEIMHHENIMTYAFVGPMLPQNPENLARNLRGKIDYILTDKMNYTYLVEKLYQKYHLELALRDSFFERTRSVLEKMI